MKSYKYIPFPELRQQYRRRQRLVRTLTDFIIAVTISAVYGVMAGGCWLDFGLNFKEVDKVLTKEQRLELENCVLKRVIG